jgi:hypothetical protein
MTSGTGALPVGLPRRRPHQITLADLGVLILGLALAFWYIRPFVTAPGATASGLGLFAYLIAARIATLAVRFAFAEVVLALVRSIRWGGYPRPAEWLALALVLSWPDGAALELYNAFYLGLYRLASHPIEIGGIIYAPREPMIGLFLALGGCLGFAAARRVIPSRARTPIIFALAVLLVWGGFPALLVESWHMVGPSPGGWPAWLHQAAMTGWEILTLFVFAWVLALPAVATLRDYLRRDRPPWSWSEWLGGATGLAMALAWVLSEVAELLARWSIPGYLRGLASLNLLPHAAAYGLAWIVVGRYGPAWDRWMPEPPCNGIEEARHRPAARAGPRRSHSQGARS